VDAVVLDGRVTDGEMWPREHEAVAISDGRIVGLGTTNQVRRLIGRQTQVIEAGGRRVVPGLIDGHLHVVRTGQSYGYATSWASIRSLAEGLERLRAAVAGLPADAWVYVPGGWTEEQVAEHRGPTVAELDAATDGRPAYVQCAYQYAVLNRAGMRLAGLDGGEPKVPAGAVERDETGTPTGRIRGVPAYKAVLDGVIGGPTMDQQVAGTDSFLARLRGLGLVGAIDAGGFRTRPESYEAVHRLADAGALDFRLRLYVHPAEPGNQVEQTREWLRHAQPRSGHPFLQIVGIGEVVHHDCHDSSGYDPEFAISAEARAELAEISQLAADYGFALHAHAIRDESVGATIDAWESIRDRSAIGRLRFSIAHGELTSERNLQRLADLGAGIGVQARMFDTGEAACRAWGEEAYVQAPRLEAIERLGIPLGGGTDGAVGHTYNPWEALWWFVSGSAVGRGPRRAEEHRLSRERALATYTRGSAWFSFEEHERGGVTPGDLADLAILTEDYFTVPEDEIPNIRAWQTIVDGRVVHSAD
jgi:predicted amidohydrolase YtcJ